MAPGSRKGNHCTSHHRHARTRARACVTRNHHQPPLQSPPLSSVITGTHAHMHVRASRETTIERRPIHSVIGNHRHTRARARVTKISERLPPRASHPRRPPPESSRQSPSPPHQTAASSGAAVFASVALLSSHHHMCPSDRLLLAGAAPAAPVDLSRRWQLPPPPTHFSARKLGVVIERQAATRRLERVALVGRVRGLACKVGGLKAHSRAWVCVGCLCVCLCVWGGEVMVESRCMSRRTGERRHLESMVAWKVAEAGELGCGGTAVSEVVSVFTHAFTQVMSDGT
jgi:hypothetical protein